MPIRSKRSKLVVAASASSFALAGLPMAAQAVELGTVDTTGVGSCGANVLIWGTGGSLVAPTDGVITKLRAAPGAGDAVGSGAIVVVRPTAGQAKVLAVEPVAFTGPGTVELTGRRIPVKAGDALALYEGADPWDCGVAGGPDNVSIGSAPAAPTVDGTFVSISSAAAKVAVGGTMEPDADGDGYGDDTQDACPSDASIHQGACQTDLATAVAASAASVELGDVTTADVTVVNAGNGKASAAKLSTQVPSGLQLLSANPRSCVFGGALTCELGDLLGGKDQVVTLTLKARETGAQAVTSKATFAGTDVNAGNDTATATIQVTEPQKATTTTASTPPARTCTVPTLKGLTPVFAKRLLEAAGCRLGAQTARAVKRGARGVVLTQAVKPRTVVPAQTAVKVTVAKRTRR